MAEGEIDNLAMEQYLALNRKNQAPGVVKPEMGGNEYCTTQSCYACSQSYLLEPLKGGWTDFPQEPLIPRISLRKLSSKGPIPGMTPAQALMTIQTMADHSQKWHDGSSSRSIYNNSNAEGIPAITEEVKSVEEVKYGEFRRPSAFSNGAKYRVGPLGYYTRIDNRPLFGEKKPSLEELMNKHLEESTRRRAEMEEWVKKLQENAEINTRNQSASLKNLEIQIEQLTKEFYAKTISEVNNSSFDQCKAVYDDKEASPNNEINEPHEVSFVSADRTHVVQEEGVSSKILSCQLPPKELNPRSFTLPCTIEILNFYVMADLGASINVIPKSMFEHLKLARLKKTDMLVEMADMTKRAPIGIVENILIKIDKFLFPSDFVVIDMLKTQNEIIILGRPFLATIQAEIDVFNKEICNTPKSGRSGIWVMGALLHRSIAQDIYENDLKRVIKLIHWI
ncbi:reverse transcriptase domain-containing protein [Tanacetum coccineum]